MAHFVKNICLGILFHIYPEFKKQGLICECIEHCRLIYSFLVCSVVRRFLVYNIVTFIHFFVDVYLLFVRAVCCLKHDSHGLIAAASWTCQ